MRNLTIEQVTEAATRTLEFLHIHLDNEDAHRDMESDLASDIADTLEFYRAARVLGDDDEEER